MRDGQWMDIVDTECHSKNQSARISTLRWSQWDGIPFTLSLSLISHLIISVNPSISIQIIIRKWYGFRTFLRDEFCGDDDKQQKWEMIKESAFHFGWIIRMYTVNWMHSINTFKFADGKQQTSWSRWLWSVDTIDSTPWRGGREWDAIRDGASTDIMDIECSGEWVEVQGYLHYDGYRDTVFQHIFGWGHTLSLSLISHHLSSTNICIPCNVQKTGYNVTALSLSRYISYLLPFVCCVDDAQIGEDDEWICVDIAWIEIEEMYLLNWLVAHASTPHSLQRTGFQSLKTHQLGM